MQRINSNKKIIRITTVPMALRYLLPGQMHFMQQNGYDVLMISADGPEREDVILNEGCRHIIVPMTRKITPLQDLKCLYNLIKIFKKEKPHIVHTHTPKAGLLGMLAAKICGIGVRIHTVAGMPLMVEKGFKLKLLRFIEKLTYWAANHVWPNSASLYNYITQHHFTKLEKLQIIGKGSTNGINLARFNEASLSTDLMLSIKQQLNFSAGAVYLLCIGRLVKDKGIVELVQVFCQLQKTLPHLKLILVGNFEAALDPLPEDILQQIKSNTGIIHITWTQHVEYYMSLASYFVFPSHREGFPNVLLQAGAMRLPIICSRIAGNIDIVENNQTGLFFQTGNNEEMQQQISFAINDKQAMQVMAEKLILKIKDNYNQQAYWNTLLKEYCKLLKTPITSKETSNQHLNNIAV